MSENFTNSDPLGFSSTSQPSQALTKDGPGKVKHPVSSSYDVKNALLTLGVSRLIRLTLECLRRTVRNCNGRASNSLI